MARTRSAEAHKKVLEAAAELFADQGIDATSMDAIAESSGVSKATIYKHWPDKDALSLEVMGYIHGLDEARPRFESQDFRADMLAQLIYEPAAHRKALKERIWPHLMAYSSRNETFGNAWRARVMEPSRSALIAMIERGERLGILRPKVDREVALAMLLGPMFYKRVFVKRLGRPLPRSLDTYVVDGFLALFGTAAGKESSFNCPPNRR
ncbi:MAG TPA: TetR/AcrR family transcriptional regulator [Acidobacteriaceae bacterium]|jgi:AcrR family transcriptional regulator|nr:TetR/AcrR family transcriptional regulator [Acidobacteriaceae bacterium]